MQRVLRTSILIVSSMIVSAALLAGLIGVSGYFKLYDSAHRQERALGLQAGIPWEWVKVQDLPEGATLPERILRAAMIGRSSVVAWQETHDSVTVVSKEGKRTAQAAPQNVPDIDNVVFTLVFVNAEALWNALLDALSKDDALVLEGIVEGVFQRTFPEQTLRQTLLPLLKHSGSLQITASGGTFGLLAHGTIGDTREFSSSLDALFKSYADSLSSTRITKRTLDERFSFTDIRYDDSMIEDSVRTQDGWTIHSLHRSQETTGLFSAVKGNRFALATLDPLLRDALNGQHPLQLPKSVVSDPLATGLTLDLSVALPLLQTHIAVPTWGTGTLLLSIQTSGERSTVLIGAQGGKLQEVLDSLR